MEEKESKNTERKEPQRYLRIVPVMIILLVIFGVAGYMLIEGWNFIDAFFMVVVTLATVGSAGTAPLSPAGKIFTAVFIVLSIGVIVLVAKWFIEFIIEGRLKGDIKKRQMEKNVKKLKGHYIVCGFGRIGKRVAEELASEGVLFVVIDTDSASLETAENLGYLYIEGDASNEETLRRAEISKAKALITAVGTPTDNVFITLTARSLNPNLFILARANDEKVVEKLEKAGADRVALPHQIGGYHMATMALRPSVVDFLDIIIDSKHDELRIEEIVIDEKSKMIGKSLSSIVSKEKNDATILAINRDDGTSTINPIGHLTLGKGDRLILMGTKEQLNKIGERLKV